MQPTNFLSPSDNLFKFMFLNGVIFILLGLFYPLEQKNNLELKILEYNKKVDLLRDENLIVKREIAKLNKYLDVKIPQSEHLANEKKRASSRRANFLKNQLENIKSDVNNLYKVVQDKNDKLVKNEIILKNDLAVVKKLIEQKDIYDSYCRWFYIIGIISAIVGFILWAFSTFVSERKNWKDMRNA